MVLTRPRVTREIDNGHIFRNPAPVWNRIVVGVLKRFHDPWCRRVTTLRAGILVICVGLVPAPLLAESVASRFVEVARDETGGHFFSQVIYARTTGELVSCGTRTHAKPIRAHETQPTSARTGVRSSRHRVST